MMREAEGRCRRPHCQWRVRLLEFCTARGDTIPDLCDTCVNDKNLEQVDAVEPDLDGDSIPNKCDNCPGVATVVPGVDQRIAHNYPEEDEMIHNYGMGATNESGWTDDITPGGPNAVYVEDNTDQVGRPWNNGTHTSWRQASEPACLGKRRGIHT